VAVLLSVNVGKPKEVSWQGRTVYTGARKEQVLGPRMGRRLNIDGDGQADTNGHGGEQRAVLVYQIASCRARMIVDEGHGYLLGVTFVGPDVEELIHSATIAVASQVPLARLWHAVPCFPSISEVWLRLLEAYRG
jgi:Pyridine nucleotide-disulphide oxidoreductase, dimerisation domain